MNQPKSIDTERLSKSIVKLRAALTGEPIAGLDDDWQPMESVPDDGTEILLAWRGDDGHGRDVPMVSVAVWTAKPGAEAKTDGCFLAACLGAEKGHLKWFSSGLAYSLVFLDGWKPMPSHPMKHKP